MKKNSAIIDANINRASEGLRVIEDYFRFSKPNREVSMACASLRKKINESESYDAKTEHLLARRTECDTRAKEPPRKRKDIRDLLKANFKRMQEALRVLEEYTGHKQYNEWRYDSYDLEKEALLFIERKKLTTGIYLISDDPEIIEKGLNWGVSMVQLRGKALSKADLLSRAYAVRAMTLKKEVPFMVNDYLDIAQLVDADGLHTGQDDLPISQLRQLLGPHKLLGRTTHCLKQGIQAEKEGADYVSVGPIWETPSKPGRLGIGFEYLEQANKELSIPFVAIGGINMSNLDKIKPYEPDLIGLIRDYENIPKINAALYTKT